MMTMHTVCTHWLAQWELSFLAVYCSVKDLKPAARRLFQEWVKEEFREDSDDQVWWLTYLAGIDQAVKQQRACLDLCQFLEYVSEGLAARLETVPLTGELEAYAAGFICTKAKALTTVTDQTEGAEPGYQLMRYKLVETGNPNDRFLHPRWMADWPAVQTQYDDFKTFLAERLFEDQVESLSQVQWIVEDFTGHLQLLQRHNTLVPRPALTLEAFQQSLELYREGVRQNVLNII